MPSRKDRSEDRAGLCCNTPVYLRHPGTGQVIIEQFSPHGENINGNKREAVLKCHLDRGFVEMSLEEIAERKERLRAEKEAREAAEKEEADRIRLTEVQGATLEAARRDTQSARQPMRSPSLSLLEILQVPEPRPLGRKAIRT